MSRFDYVKYDEVAQIGQAMFKQKFEVLSEMLDALPDGRNKSLCLTKLEECYMWLGKAIRDDQIARNGSAELQEERKDG